MIKKDDNDNYNFVQLNKGYLKEMRGLSRKSPVAMQMLLYFTEHMGRTTNAVVCSYKTLQEVTGLSRTSVAKGIKLLKEDNWLDAVKIGNATAYCVNERALWQAGRNQRQYAKFSATVIASASEQGSDYHNRAKTKLTHVPVIESNEITSISNDRLDPPDQDEMDV
jgi:hypothetical protein